MLIGHEIWCNFVPKIRAHKCKDSKLNYNTLMFSWVCSHVKKIQTLKKYQLIFI